MKRHVYMNCRWRYRIWTYTEEDGRMADHMQELKRQFVYLYNGYYGDYLLLLSKIMFFIPCTDVGRMTFSGSGIAMVCCVYFTFVDGNICACLIERTHTYVVTPSSRLASVSLHQRAKISPISNVGNGVPVLFEIECQSFRWLAMCAKDRQGCLAVYHSCSEQAECWLCLCCASSMVPLSLNHLAVNERHSTRKHPSALRLSLYDW